MELKDYLEETLHMPVDVRRYEALRGLPAYVGHLYTLYTVGLRDIRFVVLASLEETPLPSDLRKHAEVVRSVTGRAVAFAAPALSASLRSRLIREGLSFIIPGNQLYLPELAIDLREHFRAARRVDHEALTPAAQALVFYHLLLRHGDRPSTPSRIAGDLGYSAMTVGRAFDDLMAHGLATSERKGKSRYIRFRFDGRPLFEAAESYLRSPVRAVKYVKGKEAEGLPLAGESALSMHSDLAPPRIRTFAILTSTWKVFLRGGRKLAYDRDDADYAVETWSYDPRVLSDGSTVDLLSLHVQFKDNADERIAAAAESLLEEIRW